MRTLAISSFVFIVCLIILAAGQASGQGTTGWDGVLALRSSTRIIVELDGAKPVTGRLVSASVDEVLLDVKGRQTEFKRDSISRIWFASRRSRTKRAFLGALIGAGSGFLIGAAIVAADRSDPLIGAAGVLYGIPAGAVIGAATAGTKKGPLIYQR